MPPNDEPFGDIANRDAGRAYYASRNASALGNRPRVGDGRGLPGQPPPVKPDPPYVPGDNDTDQYYREGGSRQQRMAAAYAPTASRKDSKARPAPGGRYDVGRGQAGYNVARSLRVEKVADLRGAVAAAVALLTSGQNRVYVTTTTHGLEADVRAGLELATARQQITDRQAARVLTSVVPMGREAEAIAAQAFGTPDPAAVPPAGDDDLDVVMPADFAAFVAGTDKKPVVIDDEPPAAPAGGAVAVTDPAACDDADDGTDE